MALDAGSIAAIVLGGLIFVGILVASIYNYIAKRAGVVQQTDPETWEKISRYFKNIFGGAFDIFGLISVLMTNVVFLAGPIIDIINQNFKYSIASMVGFFNAVLTGAVGSSKFADFSKSFIGGILPGPNANRGWPGWFIEILSNWKSWIYIVVSLTLIIASVLSSRPLYQLSGSITAYVISFFAILLFVIVPLAGNGYLGKFSTQEGPMFGPERGGPIGLAEAQAFFQGGSLQFDSPSGYCDIPGFEWLQNWLAPVSIVLSQTILWCHLIEMWDTKNTNFISGLLFSIVLFISQYGTLYAKNCLTSYPSGKGAPIVGLIISIAGAGFAYAAIKLSTESFTVSSSDGGVFHPPPAPETEKKTDSEKLSTKIVVGPQPDTSEPVDDQDAFVCEAYKDGELITSTIVD